MEREHFQEYNHKKFIASSYIYYKIQWNLNEGFMIEAYNVMCLLNIN